MGWKGRYVMQPIMISDDEIIAIFNEACNEHRPPNVAVAEAIGCSKPAAAQRMHRLRLERPGEVLDGNQSKRGPCCPTCGARPSEWRKAFRI